MIYYESQYYGVYPIGDSFAHHGIKGQKWGVRRYRNPDGTLTEAGKKRYGTQENFERSMQKKEIRKAKLVRGLTIAAQVGGAAASAYGLYKMNDGVSSLGSSFSSIGKLGINTHIPVKTVVKTVSSGKYDYMSNHDDGYKYGLDPETIRRVEERNKREFLKKMKRLNSMSTEELQFRDWR